MIDAKLQNRLLASCVPEPMSGCWLWLLTISQHGYGQMSYKGQPKRAHRISYGAFVGEIKDGLHVLHKCDNRSCINPQHLFLGTNKDNVMDCLKKGRWTKASFVGGTKHPRAKLTEQQIKEIWFSKDLSKDIAKKYNTDRRNVYAIQHRKFWRSVTDSLPDRNAIALADKE